MDNFQTPRFRRLPGLIPTDITPHLSIPIANEPSTSYAGCSTYLETHASKYVLDEAQRLLLAADTSSLYPLQSQHGSDAAPNTPLVQELLARDSDIFKVVVAAAPPKHNVEEDQRDEAVHLSEDSARAAETASGSMSGTNWHLNEANGPTLSVPPAAKRRRTERPALASKAGPPPDPGHLQHKFEHFLTKAAQALQSEGGTAEDDDDTDDDELEGSRVKSFTDKDVRLMSKEVAKAAGVLHLVDAAVLLKLINTMTSFLEAAQSISLTRKDGEDTEAFRAVLLSLEASILCLHVMTAPNMPKQVHSEEAMEQIMEALRKHLQTNVLAFYDARLCQMHRPHLEDLGGDSEDEGLMKGSGKKEKSTSKSQKKSQNRSTGQVSKGIQVLLGRMEVALKLMGDLLAAVQVQGNLLVPLVRSVAQVLTVEGLDVLQIQVIGLIATAFKEYVAQRGAVMDEALSTVLPNISTSKRSLRKFVVSEDDGLAIQMVSALILRMLQISVSLPALDTDASAMRDCFAPATHWADVIWTYCFTRFPTAKATKSDTEMDFKNLVEHIVDDLLIVHCLPQWPIAATALLRLVAMLGSSMGLGHNDSGVRQICVDLLSRVAAQLFLEAKSDEDSALQRSLLQQSAEGDARQVGSSIREPEDALLEYLGSDVGVDSALSSSARQFILCRGFVTEVSKLQKEGGSKEEIAAVLSKFKERDRQLHFWGSNELATEDVIDLARAEVLQGPLGKARFSLLKWLQDAMDPKQAPTTRSKAVKALAGVMKVDSRLLAYQEVQACVTSALKDEAPSVKQAAVDLLGAHVSTSKELALTYFDTVTAAARDASTSVRKSALKILWDSCISVPGFSRASEACVHVLNRVADPEESIQDLVAKVFHALWFASKPDPGWEGASTTERKVADRAKQLAEVSAAIYDAGGAAIHIPLEAAHPLVAILKKALEREKGSSRRKAGSEIAAALLEGVLSANDAPDGRAIQHKATFPYLVALHAFSMSDLALCMPKADPSRFVRCLAPYLKSSVDLKSDDECKQRAEAEQLLCVLAILDALFQQLDVSIASVVAEVQADLLKLIRTHAYIQVVSAACRTLSSLAKLAPPAGSSLAELASIQLQHLKGFATNGIQSEVYAAYCQRYLFCLGHMFRYGGDVIKAAKLQDGADITVDKALEACIQLYNSRPVRGKVQESALRAMGCLGISCPTALLGDGPRSIMASALDRSAHLGLKVRALDNLAELLREEEERLMLVQHDAKPEKKGKAGKHKESEALATQNGQLDTLSLSSGILQDNWDRVLKLATDTTPVPGPARDAGDAQNARVRLSALAVIELVDRNGLVAPWTTIPHLMALATDPCREAAVRAVRVLKRLAEKRPGDMQQQRSLTSGLSVAVDFHERLQRTFHAGSPTAAEAPESVLCGFVTLFADIFQPVPTLRKAFLNMLLHPFDSACHVVASGSNCAAVNLQMLAIAIHVAAELPLKRGDEVCTVVHQINGVISRRSEDVLATLKDSLASDGEDCRNAGLANGATKELQRALQTAWKASVAVCMLLLLKTFLINTYGLTSDRVAAFQPKVEKNLPVTRTPGYLLHLDKLSMEPPHEAAQLRKHYAIFKALMKEDAANYRQEAAGGEAEGNARENGAGAASPHGMSTPAWIKASAVMTRKSSLNSRGSGGTGGGTGPRRKSNLGSKSSLGKSRSKGKKAGKRKKQRDGSSEEESEEEEDDDADFVVTTTRPRRQLEPMLRE